MKWELAQQRDLKRAMALSESLDIPSVIAQVLVNRGIDTESEIKEFFNPSLDCLSDPFEIPNMDKAVARIITALRAREHIVIFGDYDVDGLTATALLYSVLSGFGADVSWFIPDRLEEGYGLSKEGIDNAKRRGASLFISVDCGITGIEEVAYATTQGIDSIITDHHEPADVLPAATAVVDPKLIPNDSDIRDLAGVGVAFKVCQGLYEEIGVSKQDLYTHLDIVGLGTIADIVPLSGENRALAKFGLRTLEATQKPGLKELLRITGLWGSELSSWHVVFVLAPRLNAVGRIGNPGLAFKLLTTHDVSESKEYAKNLDTENEKRKQLDERIFNEAIEMVEKVVDLKNDRSIVLDSSEWHTGVIGIVASRLVERFNRPSIMISTQEGVGKGSARSIQDFHILDAIKASEHLLIKYGGHKYAAGLSVRDNMINEFREEFNDYTRRHLSEEDLVPKLELSVQIFAEEIDMSIIDWLDQFAPFGPANSRPVFLLEDVKIIGKPQYVGSDHLRMQIRCKKPVDVIGFGMAKYRNLIEETDEPVHIAFVMERNHYYGFPKLQLRLKDIAIGDWKIR